MGQEEVHRIVQEGRFKGFIVPEGADTLPPLLNQNFQAVIALGMGWIGNPQQLRVQGRASALTALTLYVLGITDRVIFSGGHTAGSNNRSEALQMRNICANLLAGAYNETHFLLETDSLDTSGNIIGLQKLFRAWADSGKALDNTLLVTTGPQLHGRVSQYLLNYGVTQVKAAAPTEKLLSELIRFVKLNKLSLSKLLTAPKMVVLGWIMEYLPLELEELEEDETFMFGETYQWLLSLVTVFDKNGWIFRKMAQKRAKVNTISATNLPYREWMAKRNS